MKQETCTMWSLYCRKFPNHQQLKRMHWLFSSQKPVKAFSPRVESVVAVNQKKKKAGIKPSKKCSSVTVMMMKEYSSKLPKGTPKEDLLAQGRIQSIKVNRQMKPDEVKRLILKAFGVTRYTVLHCDGVSKYLMKSSEQNIDGNGMVDRRGCLYLCKNMEVANYYFVSYCCLFLFTKFYAYMWAGSQFIIHYIKSCDIRECLMPCRAVKYDCIKSKGFFSYHSIISCKFCRCCR